MAMSAGNALDCCRTGLMGLLSDKLPSASPRTLPGEIHDDRGPLSPRINEPGIRAYLLDTEPTATHGTSRCCVRRFSVRSIDGLDSFEIDSPPGRERLERGPRSFLRSIGSFLPPRWLLEGKTQRLALSRICASAEAGEQSRNRSRSQLG